MVSVIGKGAFLVKKKHNPNWYEQNENRSLNLLLDLYNLRLKIIYPDDTTIHSDVSFEVYPDNERPRLQLTDDEFRKITRFFERHRWLRILPPLTAQDFDKKFPHLFQNFASLKQLYDKAIQG